MRSEPLLEQQLSFPFDTAPAQSQDPPSAAPNSPLSDEILAFEYELLQTLLSLQKSYQFLKKEAGL